MHVIQANRYKIKSSYMKKIVLIALAVIFTAATMSAWVITWIFLSILT